MDAMSRDRRRHRWQRVPLRTPFGKSNSGGQCPLAGPLMANDWTGAGLRGDAIRWSAGVTASLGKI